MKSKYGRRKSSSRKIHPLIKKPVDHLAVIALLPAAVLTLTASLHPNDQEVLAYMLTVTFSSFESSPFRQQQRLKKNTHHHPPEFNCGCFDCYISYWVRWNASPDRQKIHEVIDASEEISGADFVGRGIGETELQSSWNRKSHRKPVELAEEAMEEDWSVVKEEKGLDNEGGGINENCSSSDISGKSLMRRFLPSFVGMIGERIWGFWHN